ncbi:MAG: hypothetical protein ABR577_11335 [Pyrinomonadaceae bacterium]
MKPAVKNRVRATVAVSCLLIAASVAAAAFAPKQLTRAFALNAATTTTARPLIKVALAGVVERDHTGFPLEKVSAVNPGETLSWTIISQNDGDGAARDYKAVGQIPRGTVFIAGSAETEHAAEVTYSIDGGKTFEAQPLIEEKQADGTTKRVPAPVSAYTQVRYEWADGLAAGGKLNASYKVRVR